MCRRPAIAKCMHGSGPKWVKCKRLALGSYGTHASTGACLMIEHAPQISVTAPLSRPDRAIKSKAHTPWLRPPCNLQACTSQ